MGACGLQRVTEPGGGTREGQAITLSSGISASCHGFCSSAVYASAEANTRPAGGMPLLGTGGGPKPGLFDDGPAPAASAKVSSSRLDHSCSLASQRRKIQSYFRAGVVAMPVQQTLVNKKP